MRRIVRIFRTVVNLLLGRLTFIEKKSFCSLDLTDLVVKDFQIPQDRDAIAGDFRSFSNADKYNRDVYYIFQAFKQDFFLDHSQRDGHFRV
ncbi:MAG: hypothetical protein WAR22_14130 [Desulfomonilia bacterium]|jgi:hypothetical protein